VFSEEKGEVVTTKAEISSVWESHFRKLSCDSEGFSRDEGSWATMSNTRVIHECDVPLTWPEIRVAHTEWKGSWF
jgi:hypothetical protein